MKNFGNRIKALRRKMNLTQEELAEWFIDIVEKYAPFAKETKL